MAPTFLYFYLPNQLPVFSLGIWLYFILYKKDKMEIPGGSILIFAFLAVIGLATQNEYVMPAILWYGFAFMALAVALSKYQPRLLFNPVVKYLGTISYTLYLTHFAAIYLLERYHLTNPLKTQDRLPALENPVING